MPDLTLSAIAALRTATWPSHQRLERRIDFKSRVATVSAYRSHLEKMWGFHMAIEPRLAASAFGGVLDDFEARRKLPLLHRDLQALGSDADAVARLPRCAQVPPCDDEASAFGCAYVLEGATLGGRSLLPLVESRLGMTAGHGAAYLSSYGDAVGEMWRRFGAALDRRCAAAEQCARAAASATATFAALEAWLCGDLA